MNLPKLSIDRPIFVSCLCIVLVIIGVVCFKLIPVDLFPDVNFPVLTIQTVYEGAGPKEIETLVTKPLEEQLSKISGLKRLTSKSLESVSLVTAEFDSTVKTKDAEQKVRDQVALAKAIFPDDTKEPIIRKIDTADLPIMTLSVTSDMSTGDLFDWVDLTLKPSLEQIDRVGLVEVIGARKKEIHVLLNRRALKQRELSAGMVVDALAKSGANIPVGTISKSGQQTLFRSVGEFSSLEQIDKTLISFYGNETPIKLSEIAEVKESLVDEKSRVFINGTPSLFIDIYRQTGANTLAVAKQVKNKIKLYQNKEAKQPLVNIVRDSSTYIQDNVDDVYETIILGILLTIIVVYFFLTNMRSTIITGLAIPNSLIGAFAMMYLFGFSINIISLLALSLAVGLLIDDAIVVRENIFRKIELGLPPRQAAIEGAMEVQLAVIATSLVVIAVFAPIAFMKGVVGQFLKQFGLTVCFAMIISLFDALTIAPMLSAYFAGKPHHENRFFLVRWFDLFQTKLELIYRGFLGLTLRHPFLTIVITAVIFVASFATLTKVPITFIPEQDSGDFIVDFDRPPGTSLESMSELSLAADELVRKDPDIDLTALTVGGRNNETYQSNIYVKLKPSKLRSSTTEQVKTRTRAKMLESFASANPRVKDYDPFGGGSQPFMLSILGSNFDELKSYSEQLTAELKKDPRLTDVDLSYRAGQPEFQIVLKDTRSGLFGLNSGLIGNEIRIHVEGATPAKFRVEGKEYDVRVRMQESERDLMKEFKNIWIPNVNQRLIPLASVADGIQSVGPATIDRQNRNRYVQISAGIKSGAGLNEIMADVENLMKDKIKFPPTLQPSYVGDSENFQDMMNSMITAFLFAATFIFLILASLYESFITPITIMIALPLATCGAFFALFVTGESLNLFSLLGMVMLLGVAGKNSILLIDRAKQLQAQGRSIIEALIEAGETRLRPILMTTLALIAGTVPVAIGLNEASKQRTSMGIAIIGGLISSTLLSLVVIPSAHYYIDRFRQWIRFR